MERCGDDASPFDRRLIAPMIREPADRTCPTGVAMLALNRALR
jgi:hypothetical protein